MSSGKLWAPWRRKFLTHKKPRGCIFCTKPRSGRDAANLLVERGLSSFVMLNLYPYNNGHVMIAPYRHVDSIERLTDAETAELWRLARTYVKRLKTLLKPDGFNVGLNLGRAAGAGYDKHVHLHIVPRWTGDTNFMPVVGETKVVSESLESLRARLVAAR